MNSSIELGTIGIWTAQLDYQPAAKVREAAAELEQLGSVRFGSPRASVERR
jgi:hypothetical protein